VGNGESGLSEEIREALGEIEEPIHLQVFVTPTCPYCPTAVINAHKFAYENDKISADMVEVTEFPHLTVKYHVQGVPRSVINEETYVEGAVPDGILMDKIVEAYKQMKNG
jgi:alkyl hydroperoxide reductase subunit AhpF